MLLTMSVSVIAASILAVTFFLIPQIIQIRRTARALEGLADAFHEQIEPVSHNLSAVCQESTVFLQSLRREMDKIEEGITTLQEVTVRFREFQEEIQRSVKGPLIEFAGRLGAMVRAGQAFIRIFCR